MTSHLCEQYARSPCRCEMGTAFRSSRATISRRKLPRPPTPVHLLQKVEWPTRCARSAIARSAAPHMSPHAGSAVSPVSMSSWGPRTLFCRSSATSARSIIRYSSHSLPAIQSDRWRAWKVWHPLSAPCVGGHGLPVLNDLLLHGRLQLLPARTGPKVQRPAEPVDPQKVAMRASWGAGAHVSQFPC